MNSIFHARQFFINSGHILDIFRAKKLIDFSPPFNPYFTVRLTSKSYNGPLKVLPEGSMVEYLPVGSQEAPQTIIAKKIFQAPDPKLQSQPSVQCSIMNEGVWHLEIFL